MRDEFGRSARQRAFDFFAQGLRPAQLPSLGVPKTTTYRYFQSWKHRDREQNWRAVKKMMARDAEFRQQAARELGVSEDELAEAMKGCRSAAQLRKRLGLAMNEKPQPTSRSSQ